MRKPYDIVIIGAGSIGVAVGMALGLRGGFRVAVIESNGGVGQGQNNRAIGGIRATHTNFGKTVTCLKSIEIFSCWENTHGDDIGWVKGGYCFPAYSREHEDLLRGNLRRARSRGLHIEWMEPQNIEMVIPGIRSNGLRGGTFSPDDGRASSLLAIEAFYRFSLSLGIEFRFRETVKDILVERNAVKGVVTDNGAYLADWVINAAGVSARKIGFLAGLDVPVRPSLHLAGITESARTHINPLVVDLRSVPDCDNFYFFQNRNGQIVFTLSPTGKSKAIEKAGSVFTERMDMLIPGLKNLGIRKKWAGAYPMTPDGVPIVGEVESPAGYVNAVGMCGQGFMLGPGVGELVAHIVTGELTAVDREVLKMFSFYRDFDQPEELK